MGNPAYERTFNGHSRKRTENQAEPLGSNETSPKKKKSVNFGFVVIGLITGILIISLIKG